MDKFTTCYLSLLLLTASISADAVNDTISEEHRVGRVSGRIVKVYSGHRPEPYLCSSEGFKSDPNSCASFYRCVQEKSGKFNVFRYQCAPGTIYDPDLETCNHPKSTRRTECGGMMEPNQLLESVLGNEIQQQKELPQPIATNHLAFKQEPKTTQIYTTQLVTENPATAGPQRIIAQQIHSTSVKTDSTKYSSEYNMLSTNQPRVSKKEAYDWTQTTSIPKVTTKNSDICSDDGFIGDTENCRKFYRCVGNQRGGFYAYEFYCSESTVWDEELQSCNHPWATKRSKCGRSLPFTNSKSHQTDATTEEPTKSTAEYGQKLRKTIQQQLQISHGSKVSQTQTQISHSDEVIQNQTQINYGDRINKNEKSETKQNQTQISYDSAVSQTQTQIDYGNKGMQTQLQIDHSKDSSQSQTEVHESTTTHTSTTKQNTNSNNECSESGFMGDSNDCKKFYRCVDNGKGTYTKYEYICGDGTVWDQNIEACNHAWAVKECGGQSQSVSQTGTTQSSTHFADTTTTIRSTSKEPDPDIDDIDVGYGNQEQVDTTTTSTTSIKSTSSYKEPQHETTKKPQQEQNKSNECKQNGFMGDNNDCKKFYRCVDNGMGGFTRHEFICGEGTVWDSSIEACNHAWAVEKCGGNGETSDGSHTSEQTTSETSGEDTTTSTTTTAIDKNTNEPTYTTTISSTSSSPITESNENNVCKNSGFIGDSKNCKKFYRCVDNGDGTYTRHEFTCGEGTIWDSKIEACNHEWAVECGAITESTTTTRSSTALQSTLQDENKENEPTTTQDYNSSSITTHSPLTTTTMSNEIISTDETCTESGFVGDKNNCKKFYRCVDNGNGGYDRYEFTCGEGTVWDESISACNHAGAVKNCGVSGTNSTQNNGESSSEGTVTSSETEKEESSQPTTEKSTSTTAHTHENEVTEYCDKEGFFGSSLDCKKFIRCVDDGKGSFTKYEFTCGEGTTWNQNIEACDHPSPDRPCGEDYQSTTKESHHLNDEMITESTSKTTYTTSDKGETDVTQKPQSTTGICNSEGFNRDPSDCKKFYRCVDDGQGGYTKYEFTCGEGTVWNQEILACDHESDDQSCLSSGSKPTEASQSQHTTSGSQTESTISSSIATTNQETHTTQTTESSSSEKCTSEGFFAHPHDCKKFIRCVSDGNGEYTRYEFSCGEGTLWVQEIQACDHDHGDTKCSKQSESTTKHPYEESSSTTESGSKSTESQTQNKEEDEYPTTKQPSNTNSGECTSEGYFANKNDCRKFYRCVDNGEGSYTKYDFVCGEGTAWDSNIDNCNHINEVKSCTEVSEENSHTQQTMKDEEMSQTTESTSSTTKGSTSTSSSESNENTETGSQTESSDKCETEGYHGDSKDCKKFYRCVDDGKGGLTKYDFTCGEGTIWDQDITTCNHPQDVNNPSCKSGEGENGEESQTSSSSSTTSTTSSPESSSSPSSSENSTQSSSNCSQEESSKKPASNKDITCEKAGYYPNPNDCKKFYRCVDWDGEGERFSVYHFECGEGTIWDPALDTCNHEESVYPPRDCSQTQTQTESSETTTAKSEEETTTQDCTTTEQTTTQESTTSEETTTEKEKTTTQQSTTSEKTTEQTTATEQTTQQSTTSEQTTTEQTTTQSTTTTQESTTSEQTTTQASTTSEQTTQESTTSEQTTTQELTTSEQTTTQESTTSELTTQESTTSEQTTQESTTSEQTTDVSTTESSTSQATTEENNGQTESSTTSGTTESSTTEDNSSTTEQSSTTESEQGSTTESSSSEKECPDTEDDQYLFVCPTSFKRHPKYCNMFYQCTEDDDTYEVKIATFKCPNETIYDESQTQCVEEKEADKKCNGEMARRLTSRFKRLNRYSIDPITVDSSKKSCQSEGYFAFEKNIECSSGFLKCERSKTGKIRGFVNQCPEGYLFWTISKRCERAGSIRDCKKSNNNWQGRWNIPIDRKNVAY